MRTLAHRAPGVAEWHTAPDPSPATGASALVRPIAVATCDFDHLIVAGLVPTGALCPLGHEFVGEVVQVGDDVASVGVDDIVLSSFQISCGTCDLCRLGKTSSCRTGPWLSCFGLGDLSGSWGGAVADLVAVPYADAMLVPLPDGVSPEVAAPVGCNVVDAYRCVAPQLEQRPASPVLIVSGAFANIALYATGLALALGASRVDFFDPDREIATRAAGLGATLIDDVDDIEPDAYPITVDASMNEDLLHRALAATEAGGECTVSTMYVEATTPLPLMTMFERCLTLHTGQPHARAMIEPVLGLIASGAYSPMPIVTEVVDWEQAPAAFSAGYGKRIVTRP